MRGHQFPVSCILLSLFFSLSFSWLASHERSIWDSCRNQDKKRDTRTSHFETLLHKEENTWSGKKTISEMSCETEKRMKLERRDCGRQKQREKRREGKDSDRRKKDSRGTTCTRFLWNPSEFFHFFSVVHVFVFV